MSQSVEILEPRRRFSLAGRLLATCLAGILAFWALAWVGRRLFVPDWRAQLLALSLIIPGLVWAVRRMVSPLARTLDGLADGIRAFQDHDFSMRIATTRQDELGDLIRLYNRVGDILHEERGQIRQRELLLQSALDQSPIAIVLVNPIDRVIYANQEARQLFIGGGRLVGLRLAEILQSCPAEMRQVLNDETSGIFTAADGPESETYHVAQRTFTVNRQPHSLVLLRRMTSELSRREAEIWKKVIRIISHELNNSLAPISSLAHSGLQIAREAGQAERLEPLYASIRERVQHLTGFLEGYARFARLPEPRKETVDWNGWLTALGELYAFERSSDAPAEPGYFDPAQLQQVLINLLKNATEAGGADAAVTVGVHRVPDGGFRVQVLDRGSGMTEEVMRNAILPFYSTKPTGSGVGLPLCREIVEAHGGSLRIQARQGGGTAVSFWLPPAVPSHGKGSAH